MERSILIQKKLIDMKKESKDSKENFQDKKKVVRIIRKQNVNYQNYIVK